MAAEVPIVCPRCGHSYNIHVNVDGLGADFTMFCPMCMFEFPRRDGDAKENEQDA